MLLNTDNGVSYVNHNSNNIMIHKLHKIRVTVICARSLAKRDLFRMPDPFVKVTVDGSAQMFSTETVKNSLDPKWNAHFDVMVGPSDCITISVWNEKKVNKSNCLTKSCSSRVSGSPHNSILLGGMISSNSSKSEGNTAMSGFLGCVRLTSNGVDRLKDTGYQRLNLVCEDSGFPVKGQIIVSLMSRDGHGTGSMNAVVDDLGNLTCSSSPVIDPSHGREVGGNGRLQQQQRRLINTQKCVTAIVPHSSSSSSSNTSCYAQISSGDDELPEGWEERKTANGRPYYVNHVDKSTQWAKPTFAASSSVNPNINIKSSPSHLKSSKRQTVVLQNGHLDGVGRVTAATATNVITPSLVVSGCSEPSAIQSRLTINVGKVDNNSTDSISLPEGYERKITEQGQIYFYDKNTGKGSWHDPRLPKNTSELLSILKETYHRRPSTSSSNANLPPINSSVTLDEILGPFTAGWECRETSNGRRYFVNHTKCTTQFTDPRLIPIHFEQIQKYFNKNVSTNDAFTDAPAKSQQTCTRTGDSAFTGTTTSDGERRIKKSSRKSNVGIPSQPVVSSSNVEVIEETVPRNTLEVDSEQSSAIEINSIMTVEEGEQGRNISTVGGNAVESAEGDEESRDNRDDNHVISDTCVVAEINLQSVVHGENPLFADANANDVITNNIPASTVDVHHSESLATTTEISSNQPRQIVSSESVVSKRRPLPTPPVSMQPPSSVANNCEILPKYKKDLISKIQLLRNDLLVTQPQSGHCRLEVSRAEIFEDSYRLISKLRAKDLKKRLMIKFKGEDGIDYGGVAREWLHLLSHEMLNPYYGLFQYARDDIYCLHINADSSINPDHLSYFHFVGRIMGMAVFHGHYIDASFTVPFYKMLINKSINLRDIEDVDPELHSSLTWILKNEVTDDVIDTTFAVEHEAFGVRKTHELKTGGKNVKLTELNKQEYVRLYVNYRWCVGIEQQFLALQKGFHEIIPHSLLTSFDERELQLIIGGVSKINICDWKANTRLKHCTVDSDLVVWFWRIIEHHYSESMRAKLLQFVTGSSRVPLQGFQALQGSTGATSPRRFTLHLIDSISTDCLPKARTCFNRLDLPNYPSFEKMYEKLTQAVEETCGFAVE